jgi:hypothetical protein
MTRIFASHLGQRSASKPKVRFSSTAQSTREDIAKSSLLGLASVEQAHPGTVTFIQRFDSALRLNVHFHTLALDGVYVRADDAAGELVFHALPEPTGDEVLEVARRTAERVVSILKKHGRSVDGLGDGAQTTDDRDPAFAACIAVAARTPVLRVVHQDRARKDARAAVVMGFNVHAGAAIVDVAPRSPSRGTAVSLSRSASDCAGSARSSRRRQGPLRNEEAVARWHALRGLRAG